MHFYSYQILEFCSKVWLSWKKKIKNSENMKGMNTHPTGSKTLQNVSYYENYIFYYSIKTAACQSSRAADERTVRADIKLQQISRRTEYLKLEGTHEDHLQSDF